MPAELSFEQLEGKTSEEEVKEIFRQAFMSVENSFLESIDPKIAERSQLLEKIPDNMTQFEAAQQYPDLFNRLQDLEEEIRGGTTAVVALVYGGILYVGNVGDSRALLCQKDKSGVLKVRQLTTDHTTSSYEEMERLNSLSLDTNKIKGAKLGSNEITRCIGNYFLKGGYKEFDMLASAIAEPVICEPYITSVPIDESCSFFLLMSDGLYKSYEEATGSEHANKEIATMVVEQFLEQTTLTSVAQTVVDKVVRLHHDAFLTQKGNVSVRDDITLVIRNFNFHFPSSFQPQTSFLSPNVNLNPSFSDQNPTTSNTSSDDEDLTLRGNYDESISHLRRPPRTTFGPLNAQESTENESTSPSIFHTSTTSTESSKLSNPSLTQLTLDEDGRIRPYVCFDAFFKNVEKSIANETIPKAQIYLYK
ncbi:TGF-beta-activated kinase 1 and MAP3K7-binding protein 1 [Armadillidium vulgare]|nr:TGF-beta-activated kinase 1 and MAP3K7-binding protein 1 [Armadillidium vulgare]